MKTNVPAGSGTVRHRQRPADADCSIHAASRRKSDMATTARSPLATRNAWQVLLNVCRKFIDHECFAYSAALAFYFLVALFPFLIFMASSFAYLPVPHLFERVVRLLDRIVPPEGMRVIHYVLDATLPTSKTLLSAAFVGALWASAAGFHSIASVMNRAYEVRETRSFLRRRLLALGFTCLLGCIAVLAMTLIAMGPRLGFWMTGKLGLRAEFAVIWPVVRWTIFLTFMALSIGLLYSVGPNTRARFRTQLPGALIAVAIWLFASGGLAWYFRSVTNVSRLYGGLGAVIVLMLWFYASAVALLVGIELSAELTRRVELVEGTAA